MLRTQNGTIMLTTTHIALVGRPDEDRTEYEAATPLLMPAACGKVGRMQLTLTLTVAATNERSVMDDVSIKAPLARR